MLPNDGVGEEPGVERQIHPAVSTLLRRRRWWWGGGGGGGLCLRRRRRWWGWLGGSREEEALVGDAQDVLDLWLVVWVGMRGGVLLVMKGGKARQSTANERRGGGLDQSINQPTKPIIPTNQPISQSINPARVPFILTDLRIGQLPPPLPVKRLHSITPTNPPTN